MQNAASGDVVKFCLVFERICSAIHELGMWKRHEQVESPVQDDSATRS